MINDITIEQLCRSDTAEQCGINNIPCDKNVISNLQNLIDRVLLPVMMHFGKPLDITSGYRCSELNQKLNGTPDSQHQVGEAVDFGIMDMDIYDIASWIQDNIEFDQLVMENRNPSDLNKGWVHVSYRSNGTNRKQALTINEKGRFDGIIHES